MYCKSINFCEEIFSWYYGSLKMCQNLISHCICINYMQLWLQKVIFVCFHVHVFMSTCKIWRKTKQNKTPPHTKISYTVHRKYHTYVKGVTTGAYFHLAIVLLYLDFKLHYFKNSKLFTIIVKEVFELLVFE